MLLSLKLALATTPKPCQALPNTRSSGSDAVSSMPCSLPPLPLNGADMVPVVCTGTVMPAGGTQPCNKAVKS